MTSIVLFYSLRILLATQQLTMGRDVGRSDAEAPRSVALHLPLPLKPLARGVAAAARSSRAKQPAAVRVLQRKGASVHAAARYDAAAARHGALGL